MRFGVQQDGGDTPVVQHVVGAHARSAAGAVDGQEFEIQLGGHPYRQRQIGHPERPGLQRQPRRAVGPELFRLGRDFGEHVLGRGQGGVGEAGVAGEVFDASGAEGLLYGRNLRIGAQAVAAALHEPRVVEIADQPFAVDGLGALPPFDFDAHEVAVLAGDVISHAVVGVVGVELDEQRALAIVIAPVHGDAAVQIGQGADGAVGIEFGLVVPAAHIFPDDQRDAAQGRAHGEAVPVLVNHGIAAQRADEERIVARVLGVGAHGRGQIGVAIGRVARAGLFRVEPGPAEDAAPDAQGIVGNAHVRGVFGPDGGVAVVAGHQRPAPHKRTQPRFAAALTVRAAEVAQPGFAGRAAVDRTDFFVVFGCKAHARLLIVKAVRRNGGAWRTAPGVRLYADRRHAGPP